MAPYDDMIPGRDESPDDEAVRDALRSIFGDRADDVLDEMRSQGINPASLMGDTMPSRAQMEAAFAQMRQMFSASGDDPVNAALAHDLARQVAATGGDPSLTAAQAREVADAMRAAELWLDAATTFPPSSGAVHAWSRAEWVEATLPAWQTLVAPVAASVGDGLATVLGAGASFEVEIDGPGFEVGVEGPDLDKIGLGGLTPAQMIRRIGGAAFGMQVGQAAGTLSREVFGGTDVGLPLLPSDATALLPTNIAAFAAGLDIPADDVRAFLAVREAAHARLFTHVPWIRTHLLSLVERYAREIEIDLNALENRVRGIDASNASNIHAALAGGGLFAAEPSATQRATLLQLETALALVEGWVDEVSTQAVLPQLPDAIALREMVRRRRAAGGPAETTFASLVGLELRPRRARDAATLFGHVYVAGGIEGRDAVWAHPDLIPDSADLDAPASYLARREAQRIADQEIDSAIADLLSGGE